MEMQKRKTWRIIFYIGVFIYMINLFCILVSGNCIFVKTTGFYNYTSIILNAVFMFIFYGFLRKGSLTTRYLAIMFIILVLIPLLIAIASGGIRF
ncbi:MAG: hypothetical protein R6W99_06110 [Clostridia bacterium]